MKVQSSLAKIISKLKSTVCGGGPGSNVDHDFGILAFQNRGFTVYNDVTCFGLLFWSQAWIE